MNKGEKDYNGKEIISCIGFESCPQLTVGELKECLEGYPNDALVYVEASNAFNKNDTMWSQKALGTYSCKQHMTDKKALMIVGSMK